MNSSTVWLLCLLGAALLYQGMLVLAVGDSGCGGCRPNDQPDADYPQDGDNEDDYGEENPDEELGPEPEIISKPLTLDVQPGGVALMPCDISGKADLYARIWRKDENTGLFVGSVKQTQDDRISSLSNGTLEIRHVRPEDNGEYTCVVSSKSQQKITHFLRVNTPAMITKIVPGEKIVSVKKHGSLTLECHAQGHPTPKLNWFRNNHLLEDQDPSIHGARYTINDATEDDSGVYKCTASNGQQRPDEQMISVVVSYPPEIKVVKEIVATGEGYESELKCTVNGIKRPELKWYKDNEQKPLRANDKIKFEQNGAEHILRILKTVKSDFGVYKCEAKNSEGQSSADILLTGTPTKPVADKVVTEGDSKSPMLVFVVESFAPILEYELLYKKEEANEWVSVKPTVGPASATDDKLYTMKHVLTGLEPGVYNAQVKAKNSYGWSELSSIQTFPQEHAGDLTETGLLAVSSTASELRISLALFSSLLVARYYC